ncbi:iron-containing alcohol dehydrogenase [Vibrio maritimus]|uniref:Iron-containing alcohol dehydrogenase n=1 Tax=Vibrio maritimus TaxID=990268 RepID=A0A090RZX3_9VIBR|nr:iron-containing alcohol dehydrogenase [Vibrio maritimus]
MMENIKAAKRAGRSDVLNRYRTMAQILTGRNDASIEDSIQWVNMILERLALPQLSEFGVCGTSFEQVAADAMKSMAIKGNPIPLTEDRLIYILNQVCQCNCDGSADNRDDSMQVEYRNNPIETD